jgi:hypothetical protein
MPEQQGDRSAVVITPPTAGVAQVLVNGEIVATIERAGQVARVSRPNGESHMFGSYATACHWVIDHAGAWATDEGPSV